VKKRNHEEKNVQKKVNLQKHSGNCGVNWKRRNRKLGGASPQKSIAVGKKGLLSELRRERLARAEEKSTNTD